MTASLAGLASVLAHLTWQGALVVLAAVLALRLVGPRASVARYRIAMAALALLTLAPAGTLARRGGWLAGTSPGWVAAVPEWTRRVATPDPFPAPIDASPAEAGAHPPVTGNRIERTWRAAMPWLLLAWLLGVVLCLARLAGGIVRLHALRRRSTIASPAVTREVELLARRLGLTSVPEVRVSGDVGIPLTFGALRPVVLLPRRFADDLPADQVRL